MSQVPIHFQGKSYPMTALTPVRWWLAWVQGAINGAFRMLFWFQRLSGQPGLATVRKLKFIHFARWVMIGRNGFPVLTPDQPKNHINHRYYLFTTNFNGSWDQYIDAFGTIDKVAFGLNWLWRTSRGFPGCWPIRNFKRYIHYFEYPLELYYNAYPHASVRDIHAAKRLNARLLEFIDETAEPMDDAEFHRRYQVFLTDVAADMGHAAGAPEDLPSTRFARPRGLQV